MRSLFFVVSVVALAGCLTPPEEDCGPSNCTGCCDTSGQCQPGINALACGQAGSMCLQCPGGQCFAGTCVPGSTGGGAASGGGTATGGGSATGGGAATGGGDGTTGGGDGTTGGGVGTGGGSTTGGGDGTRGGGSATGGGTAGGGVGTGGGAATGGGVGTGGGTATGGGSAGGGVGTGGGAATGGGSATCDAASCPGGCCVGPLCVLPTNQNDFSCGIGGNSCQPCAANSACMNGQCVSTATCNAASCPNGCCSGNLCVPYGDQSTGLCGTAGASCTGCGAGLSCNSGQCTATTACDFFSCAGCCSGGACLATASQTTASCGVNGASCSPCLNGSTCTAGACTGGTTCNETNCNGCCNGNTCVTATGDNSCGQLGSACVSCGPGRVCNSGTCITQANPACLLITPNDFDFGAVRTTCRSPVTTVTIRNICATNVTLTAIGLTGNPGFTNGPLPTLPLTLASNQSASITVTWTPPATGPASTTLVLGAVQNASSVVYQTVFTGSGNTTGVQADIFNIPLKTDAVLIIDDSCSMDPFQASLGANANALLAYPISAGVDFNVGVTTSDDSSTRRQGRFVASDGGAPLILTESTPNLLQQLTSRVRVGTFGDAFETFFSPSVKAVTPPLITTTNVGFLRTDSNLSFMVLTDAVEQSTDSAQLTFEKLMAVRGWRNRNRLSWSAVAPTLPSAPSGCFYEETAAGSNPRIAELVSRTGGYRTELCNLNNATVWRPEAQRMGQAVFGARSTWFLTSVPSPAVAGSVVVAVAGIVVPEMNGATRNWSYDAARNAIVFERQSLPAPGQSVSMTYTPACAP